MLGHAALNSCILMSSFIIITFYLAFDLVKEAFSTILAAYFLPVDKLVN